MRRFLILSTAILTACTGEPRDFAAPDAPVGDSVHERVLTLDTHIDIPLDYMDAVNPKFETALQVDIPKLREGHLDSGFWIIYTPQGELTEAGYAAGLEIAETRYRAIQNLATSYPQDIEIALTAGEVRKIVKSGRLAVLLGMENAYPLGEDIRNVPIWARRGVRYMGLTHFGHNQFGDSSNPNETRDDGPRYGGLSVLGKRLIGALNEHGVMVDVSHTGKATMMQAASLSATPIIASHSGAKAIGDSPRNLDDEQLLKIKDVGGVAQMVALGVYVKPLNAEQNAFRDNLRAQMNLETSEARSAMSEAVEAEYERRLEGMWAIEPAATVADFVDHIDHAVDVAGIDHVGIASDFDGGGGVTGWQDASQTENVTAELIARGYSETDIEKIWSGNLLRVLHATEDYARSKRK